MVLASTGIPAIEKEMIKIKNQKRNLKNIYDYLPKLKCYIKLVSALSVQN